MFSGTSSLSGQTTPSEAHQIAGVYARWLLSQRDVMGPQDAEIFRSFQQKQFNATSLATPSLALFLANLFRTKVQRMSPIGGWGFTAAMGRVSVYLLGYFIMQKGIGLATDDLLEDAVKSRSVSGAMARYLIFTTAPNLMNPPSRYAFPATTNDSAYTLPPLPDLVLAMQRRYQTMQQHQQAHAPRGIAAPTQYADYPPPAPSGDAFPTHSEGGYAPSTGGEVHSPPHVQSMSTSASPAYAHASPAGPAGMSHYSSQGGSDASVARSSQGGSDASAARSDSGAGAGLRRSDMGYVQRSDGGHVRVGKRMPVRILQCSSQSCRGLCFVTLPLIFTLKTFVTLQYLGGGGGIL